MNNSMASFRFLLIAVSLLTFVCVSVSTGCDSKDADNCEAIFSGQITSPQDLCRKTSSYVSCYLALKSHCTDAKWQDISKRPKNQGIDVETYSSSVCCDPVETAFYTCNVSKINGQGFNVTKQQCVDVTKCVKSYFETVQSKCTATLIKDATMEADQMMAKTCDSVSTGCEEQDVGHCEGIPKPTTVQEFCGKTKIYAFCYQTMKPYCTDSTWNALSNKLKTEGIDVETYSQAECCDPVETAISTCDISQINGPGFKATKQQCVDVNNARNCTKNYISVVQSQCTSTSFTDILVEADKEMAKKIDTCNNGQRHSAFTVLAVIPAILLGLRGHQV